MSRLGNLDKKLLQEHPVAWALSFGVRMAFLLLLLALLLGRKNLSFSVAFALPLGFVGGIVIALWNIRRTNRSSLGK